MKKRLLTALMVSCIILAGCGRNIENAGNIQTPPVAAEQASESETAEGSGGQAEAGSVGESAEDSSEAATEAGTAHADKDSDSKDASGKGSSIPKAPSSEGTTATEENKDNLSASDPASAENQPSKEQTPEAEPEREAQPQEISQEKKDYGRIIFIGDSRTVDIFDAEGYEVYDRNEGGVRVFAENGKGYDYMMELLDRYDESYDTVITWLGCNDHYNIQLYKTAYEALLARGINLVICNVGPTINENLDEWDSTRYRNEDMEAFNREITAWAQEHGVRVIDMYSYVYANLQIDDDGIHYGPKPTSSVWSFIMGSL